MGLILLTYKIHAFDKIFLKILDLLFSCLVASIYGKNLQVLTDDILLPRGFVF